MTIATYTPSVESAQMDPFNDRFNSPSRPERSYNHSPRKFVPSGPSTPIRHANPFSDTNDTHMNSASSNHMESRYSPSVSFGRRSQAYNVNDEEHFQTPFASPTKQQQHYQQSPIHNNLTPRKLYTELESPMRKSQSTVIVIDDSDNEDDNNNSSSYYGNTNNSEVSRSPTRSSNGTRILPPPKPIFSATTYAAANSINDTDTESYQTRTPSGGSTIYSNDYEKQKMEPVNSRFSGDTYNSDSDDENVYNDNLDDDDEESHNSFDEAMMYEVPTDAQPRRHNSTKRTENQITKDISVNNGNLVLENPVPTKLASLLPRKDADEFLFMRYSAVTSEPDEFVEKGFELRAAKLNREIEIAVCITMYNESEIDFTRTMHNVMKNVAHLCSRERSRVWGPNGWKKVQVIIVSDGRMKINKNVLDVLATMGVYQDGIAKSTVNEKPVKAHLFEYTTQISLDENLEFKSAEKGLVPVQVLFCLKEENKKKINSHRWLFNAFCKNLKPKAVVLLDVGTKPNKTALYHFWKCFDRDSNVAGAAGEIKAIKGKGWRKLLNPLVASQNFEYKMSNILDKPLESVFGYISVLPGALSAYRYKALLNNEDGTGPLNSYFKGESLQGPNRDVFSANMYLAEDRILCWELVAKRDSKWVLKYVKDAQGETDLPETVPEFISQRRRWLNGALFAAIYSQLHFKQIWTTRHSKGRKVALHVEFIYQFVQLLFSWFSIGNFYLTFYFLAGSLQNKKLIAHNGGFWIFTIFNYICVSTLASMFIISMGNRPQGAVHLFIIGMALLSICSTFALICGLYFVIRTFNSDYGDHSSFVNIIISLLSTYGLYAFMSIVYLDPWHILTCSVQYFVLLPSYTCTLQIFAFCNTHDVSWGTKGDNKPVTNLGAAVIETDEAGHEIYKYRIDQMDIDSSYQDKLNNIAVQRLRNKQPEEKSVEVIPDEDYYRDIRTRVVLAWLISNLILVMIVSQVYSPDQTAKNKYLAFILWSVAVLAAFRAVGSIGYLFLRYLRMFIESKHKFEKDKGINFSVKKLFKRDS